MYYFPFLSNHKISKHFLSENCVKANVEPFPSIVLFVCYSSVIKANVYPLLHLRASSCRWEGTQGVQDPRAKPKLHTNNTYTNTLVPPLKCPWADPVGCVAFPFEQASKLFHKQSERGPLCTRNICLHPSHIPSIVTLEKRKALCSHFNNSGVQNGNVRN